MLERIINKILSILGLCLTRSSPSKYSLPSKHKGGRGQVSVFMLAAKACYVAS